MMEDQVKDMFERIAMPEDTEQRIRQAMTENRKPRRRFPGVLRGAATMAAMLALILVISPTARAAVDDMVRYAFGEGNIIIDAENGTMLSVEAFDTEGKEAPVFVEVGNGEMYFFYDGQYIDITDKTSMDTPYIHKYVDEENIEHIIIIGGEADNFGVSEFYRETGEDIQPWQGWIGGYSDNYFDNSTGKAYPWLAAAWEELNLPWPLPGT